MLYKNLILQRYILYKFNHIYKNKNSKKIILIYVHKFINFSNNRLLCTISLKKRKISQNTKSG